MKKMHLMKWAGLSLELLMSILIIMLVFLNRPVPDCLVALLFGGLLVCVFASCPIAVNLFPRLKTVYEAGKNKGKEMYPYLLGVEGGRGMGSGTAKNLNRLLPL